MALYRFYFLNMANAIESAAEHLNAETDAAARLGGEELFRLKGARFSGFELWHGNHRVHRNFKVVGEQ